ncbi:DUF1700 domain-containing protein [Actinoplanes sp. KI2]|uniref:DUF1700 domain-containing protein n=1 Tax=Actinoplanes sp. KI2 TaxID=2983315 RepID=UPI0021D5B5D0|nr:DUF1700 domain-containing protein [Actinoplanes sp. KI2]MCU7724193.1 DUF1700 domain-containing protein [Actinoplanes sp. KI2]
MKTQYTDVVAEYLREVDLRLAGLPVLQRRELLADLAAHIETERAERHLRGEAELIEVLERLGSPDVVARAAYEEAGPLPPIAGPPSPPPVTPPPRRDRAPWVLPIVGAGLVAFLVMVALCAGVFLFARSSGSPAEPVQVAPEASVAPTTPPAPAPSITG